LSKILDDMDLGLDVNDLDTCKKLLKLLLVLQLPQLATLL